MDLKKVLIALALGTMAFSVVGCDDDDDGSTTTTGGGLDINIATCADAANPTIYRITTLHIPTSADIDAGNDLGHNVDGVGMVCGGPDYAGGVDNALLDLAATLPTLGGGGADAVDLQAEIDAGINCSAADETAGLCSPLLLDIEVSTGTNCVSVRVLDGSDSSVLAGPFSGTLDASGNMYGFASELDLSIPYATEDSSGNPTTVNIDLSVSNVIVTGTLSGGTITDIVLGGYLVKSSFEATLMTLVPLISDSITFEDVAGILANLYDVQVDGGCNGLSVGLTGAASTP